MKHGAAGITTNPRASLPTRKRSALESGQRTRLAGGAYGVQEGGELVTDKDYARREFLDGAARVAQTLGLVDSAAYLERAWLASPSLPRWRG